MRVEELMTRDVVSVLPSATLKVVADVLVERRISGVPVCDLDARVLGVLSEADILAKEQGYVPDRGWLARLLETADGAGARIAARTAGEAMTSPAITISPGATAVEAARLMLEKRVNRLPVVVDGRLTGILARSDLIRAFDRSDEEIEREIVEDVLLRTLWIGPDAVAVAARDGEVSVTGEVETRTDAELVERLVRRVPGVVSVETRLGWKFDDRERRARRPRRLPGRV